MEQESVIYVVATPIGNLDDISRRATQILKNVDIVAAEDTRRARLLLQQLGREKVELVSYYDHVEREKAEQLIARLKETPLSLALISDAGTPCISDPGYRLVRAAREAGIKVHPIPGASALTTLVSASGLPSDRLLFVGFLPNKRSALEKEVKTWRATQASIVFYEAPRRLNQTLSVIGTVYPQAELVIGRELTKLHEEIIATDIEGAKAWCLSHEFLKGEASVMLWPGPEPEIGPEAQGELRERIRKEALFHFRGGASLKDVMKLLKDKGLSRSELYQTLLETKEGDDESE